MTSLTDKYYLHHCKMMAMLAMNVACESKSQHIPQTMDAMTITEQPIKMVTKDMTMVDMTMTMVDMTVDNNPDMIPVTIDMEVSMGDFTVIISNQDLDEDDHNDRVDNCPQTYNEDQEDFDDDGVGDICDNCPLVFNPNQRDSDLNSVGEACEFDGPGIEVILTHNGDHLSEDVFLDVTPPYVERFNNEVCNESNDQSTCMINDQDTVQAAIFTPVINGTYLISVKLTDDLETSGLVTVQVSCNQVIRKFSLMASEEYDVSIWDVAHLSWPNCQIRPIELYDELSCNQGLCSCSNCVESICPPEHCSSQVTCDGYTGLCDTSCNGRLCQMGQSCNPITGVCEDAQCMSCSERQRCPYGYFCYDHLLASGVCLEECMGDFDCVEGFLCNQQQVSFLETRYLCSNPPSICR